MPIATSGRPMRAVSSATRKSQASASSNPPPSVQPCSAAIDGCGSAATCS